MTSKKQLIANRENGKLGGPKTEAGKAAVRLNSVTHGLLSKEVLLKGEDAAELNRLRNNFMAELAPEGELETMHVDLITACLWRLKRAYIAETAMLNHDFNYYMLHPEVKPSLNVKENLSRYETMIDRQMTRAIHELERKQRIRKGENTPAPLVIDLDVSQQS